MESIQNNSKVLIKLSFKNYWNHLKYSFTRLDAIYCTNCERIYPYRWFCGPKVNNYLRFIIAIKFSPISLFRFVINPLIIKSFRSKR